MTSRRAHFVSPFLCLLPITLAGCGAHEPVAPPAPVRVENVALGIAFSELPAGVSVTRNVGDALELSAADDGGAGRLTVRVGPDRDRSILLVEEAQAFGAEATAGGGTFFGGNELVTPYGSAYTVRAAHADGTEVRRILMVHPGTANRLLTLELAYPQGDQESARRRLQQMLELVTVLEPLGAAPGG